VIADAAEVAAVRINQKVVAPVSVDERQTGGSTGVSAETAVLDLHSRVESLASRESLVRVDF